MAYFYNERRSLTEMVYFYSERQSLVETSGTDDLPVLTMLRTSGDAPLCSRSKTMLRWPMKAATWIGVRPDWTDGGRKMSMKCKSVPCLQVMLAAARPVERLTSVMA